MADQEYEDLIVKYKERIKSEFGDQAANPTNPSSKITSVEYTDFKKELYPGHYSLYEKACNFSQNILKLKLPQKQKDKLQKHLDICHLNTTPSGVIALSMLLPLAIVFLGSFISFAIFNMMFFVMFFLVAGFLMVFALQKVPEFMANSWRMKASNQMVQSVFYLVTYMRHTSNLERAIEFAGSHLNPPLSLDFRKILWDTETERYPNIRESADSYLQTWKEWNKDFVEAFHLIEASLLEPSEDRRLSLLDKSLDVILDGTYENMLQYAHSLKSPMTMLNMLGIILPILGLVILPLVVSFMSGPESSAIRMAIYISMLYNVSLPIGVYYLGRVILSKRPAGYGHEDIAKHNKGVKKYQNVLIPITKTFQIAINPMFFALTMLAVTMLIGFSPIIFHTLNPAFEIQDEDGNYQMLGYVCPPEYATCEDDIKVGPYGIGASLLSLVVVSGLGVSLGLYFSLRSKNVIKIRQNTNKLEDEFSSALFQLGNRLGDGLPAEIAFGKVSEAMKGTTSGDFFSLASHNITRLGMGLEEALFNSKVGAVVQFPSKVIESSMKVLIESSKKGPMAAAEALLSMSRYIKEIHRVEERLKDLMGEIIGSMKAQVAFLTPAIAGIVVGITSMISTVLTKLSAQLTEFASDGASAGYSGMLTIFGIGIPTFHFQIIVGVYIVQLAYILTVLANGIENGSDKLAERYSLGKALINGTLLYCFIAGVVMILFNAFAGSILMNTF
ncbi:hypothetical protein HN385_00695 [archaeon]|jgi:hypothetical protein|nr:hypothetical protein [archaeon]MBT3450933.1 hypothetical protein [archaeon]MBT6869579.1 hypothetical protein [archaeon]MBT7193429.1 hypothetical protein [archaeon]MBT7381020.1 hypothetical protein [archaeon]